MSFLIVVVGLSIVGGWWYQISDSAYALLLYVFVFLKQDYIIADIGMTYTFAPDLFVIQESSSVAYVHCLIFCEIRNQFSDRFAFSRA